MLYQSVELPAAKAFITIRELTRRGIRINMLKSFEEAISIIKCLKVGSNRQGVIIFVN